MWLARGFHLLMLSNFVLISGRILDMFWFYLSSMAYCYICLHCVYESSILSQFLALSLHLGMPDITLPVLMYQISTGFLSMLGGTIHYSVSSQILMRFVQVGSKLPMLCG